MNNFKVLSFLMAFLSLLSTNSIAQTVIVTNTTHEVMHVIFQTALPGECFSETDPGDPIDNDGDSSPGLINPGTSVSYQINPRHVIIWASASPRPACCDHESAIDNQAPDCGFQNSRQGQHSACHKGFCTPANGSSTFNVAIINVIGSGGTPGQDITVY